MSLFLTLAYLFFIGSVLGWCIELLFRKFFSTTNPEHKWINPGFCVGSYLPIYGFGLCTLYLLAWLGDTYNFGITDGGRLLLFAAMAVSMTLIEYLAGILLLKWMKLRLWDYRSCWGNVQGLICPLFSLIWAVTGTVYYFLVHPCVLDALSWLSDHLAFSFVIGFFFGVFTIDVVYSGHLVARLKRYAEENEVVIRYENLKSQIHRVQDRLQIKPNFFFPLRFQSDWTLRDYLKDAQDVLEKRRRKRTKE